jgi:uncharacterized protein (DUF779 family)
MMMRKERDITVDLPHYIEIDQYTSSKQQATIVVIVSGRGR